MIFHKLQISGFSIVPHPDWVLQVGVEYDITVQIYSHDNRKVFITDVRILLLLIKRVCINLFFLLPLKTHSGANNISCAGQVH